MVAPTCTRSLDEPTQLRSEERHSLAISARRFLAFINSGSLNPDRHTRATTIFDNLAESGASNGRRRSRRVGLPSLLNAHSSQALVPIVAHSLKKHAARHALKSSLWPSLSRRFRRARSRRRRQARHLPGHSLALRFHRTNGLGRTDLLRSLDLRIPSRRMPKVLSQQVLRR